MGKEEAAGEEPREASVRWDDEESTVEPNFEPTQETFFGLLM